MRMFLTGMTDIFLILYLTSMTSANPPSIFTVDDLHKLQAMHEALRSDKQKAEEEFHNELRLAKAEKDDLVAKLADEQTRAKEIAARVGEDLQSKENVLKEREQMLAQLDQKIKDMQAKEASWQQELRDRRAAEDASRALAQKLELEAQDAQRLAEQMQSQARQAQKAAEESRAFEEKAMRLKDEALKKQEEAERQAREALEARKKAEAEKENALKIAEEAKRIKEQAEKEAGELASAIAAIKQDSDAAYQNNVRPFLAQLNVSYEQEASNTRALFRRELTLLPVKIEGGLFVLFPSAHIGFTRMSDKAPHALRILYKGQLITHGWFNKEHDFVALSLPSFSGQASAPYASDVPVDQLMPVLLAIRDGADRKIGNFLRNLSDEYFVVNRDNIRQEQKGILVHSMTGLRGTGMRAERVLQGDQLVDLNARLIGIAKDADHIIRIDSLKGWEEREF